MKALEGGVPPRPAADEVVTVDDVAAGLVALLASGKVHVAKDRPDVHVGGGGAVVTVKSAVAVLPVSTVPTNRLLVVLV